jgi:hypothetical protein
MLGFEYALCPFHRTTFMDEHSPHDPKSPQRLAPFWRAVIEVGFIVFLYYSNLLMGEYEGTGQGRVRGLLWALGDTMTLVNLLIAVITALIGYLVIEFLRKRF